MSVSPAVILFRLIRHCIRFLPLLLSFSLLVANSATAAMPDYSQQRQVYQQAQKALRSGQHNSFARYYQQLQNYPLKPYLDYGRLKRALGKARKNTVQAEAVDREVLDFLINHAELPLARYLRQRWLSTLAARQRWIDFLHHFRSTSDASLNCLKAKALHQTGETTQFRQLARKLWRVGKRQPAQCNFVFNTLEKRGELRQEDRWARAVLLVKNGQTSLAKTISQKLSKEAQENLQHWIAVQANATAFLKKAAQKPFLYDYEVVARGIHRIAPNNAPLARQYFLKFDAAYQFPQALRRKLQTRIAIHGAAQRVPESYGWLREIPAKAVTDRLRQWQLREALYRQDWDTVLELYSRLSSRQLGEAVWQYWAARAYEATGEMARAKIIYTALAEERGYYHYLAADRAGLDYAFNPRPQQRSAKRQRKLQRNPFILRARELWLLGEIKAARREWVAGRKQLSKADKLQAALLAHDWGWHSQAIRTLANAGSYGALELRYPTPHPAIVQRYAKQRLIDSAWIYGIMRSESLFMPDAKSPVGARGLMQLMPATGRLTAREDGLKLNATKELEKPAVNIRLGSYYLESMLRRFAGNQAAATAAYNAGPARIARSIPQQRKLPADIWVDTLNLFETRKYVRRVMETTIIFDWLADKKITRLKQRMQPFGPKTDRGWQKESERR